MRTLYLRILRLCSPHVVQAEFDFLYKCLLSNAYPAHFIDKYKVTELPNNPIVHTVEKKPIYLQVPFYGDKTASFLRKSVSQLITNNFPAAKPLVTFRTTPIPVSSLKDRLPDFSSSSLVYKFVCDCGSVYYGRTSRSLAVRAAEHVPKWLITGGSGRSGSAITSHVLQCDCVRGSLRDKFSIVFRARNDRVLRILEALSIKLYKPDLCKQKDHVIDLLLPW